MDPSNRPLYSVEQTDGARNAGSRQRLPSDEGRGSFGRACQVAGEIWELANRNQRFAGSAIRATNGADKSPLKS